MPDILLTTFNAKYAHASFGLRYLRANLGELKARAALLEFDLQTRPVDAVEQILAAAPRIVGVGVYLWNLQLVTETVTLLKQLRPDVKVVLGGPEVSFGDPPAVATLADAVVVGEGDIAFRELCAAWLQGQPMPARGASKVPQFGENSLDISLPYDEYSDTDLTQRTIYVEASRGCPFGCEFCLSALLRGVRRVPLGTLLPAFERLLGRGLTRFKFVDRTFNLEGPHAGAILEFFLARLRPGLQLHFEMVPDHMPAELERLLPRFPAGALHLEVGIQSLNEEVLMRIGRRQDSARTLRQLRFLREQTGAELHLDLILGLPGETLESMAHSFDTLWGFRPHELQVGILKRLRGALIARHDEAWAMQYNPWPPYDVLATSTLSFTDVQRLKRLARFWDLLSRRGFERTLSVLLAGSSAFGALLAFSDWLYAQTGQTHAIALIRLANHLVRYLVETHGMAADAARALVMSDYDKAGRDPL